MKDKKNIDYVVNVILLILAILPLIYFNQVESVPIKIFILGTGSWGFGNIFKVLAHQIITVRLHNKNKSVLLTSISNGLLSGFFELFAAYLLILLTINKFEYNYNAIICFGLAIGSFEIIVAVWKGASLFKGTTLEKSIGKLEEYLETLHGIKYFFFNMILPIIERVIATFIHISTRGLVFITIITGNVLPFIIALIVFVIADGILGYYYHITGRLATSKGYIQIHLYLFILTAISTAIFFIWISPYKDIVL